MRKNTLYFQAENLTKDIIELQKEAEQFSYILEEEKKRLIKRIFSSRRRSFNRIYSK